jgi:hypothetical protein
MTYDLETYNCSHFVAEYYAARGLQMPAGAPSAWGYRFIRWMRQHFHAIAEPAQDCLVLVKYRGHGSFHVGVYDDGMMVHNHRIGQVIRTPLPLMRRGADLTYWALNG